MANPFDQFDFLVAANPFDQFDRHEANPFDQFDTDGSANGADISMSEFPNEFADNSGRTLGGTIKDVGISLYKGVVGLEDAAVGLVDMVTPGNLGGAYESGMKWLTGTTPKEAVTYAESQYSDAQKEANRKVNEAEGFLPTTGALLKNPSVVAHSLVESAPSMLAAGGIGRGLVLVEGAASPVLASAAGEGLISSGSTHEQIRQGSPSGNVTPMQSNAAALSGFTTGTLTMIGGRLANRLGFGDIDTMLASGSREVAGKGGVKEVARRIIGGGISEGFFEEMPQSAQERIWLNAATGRPLLDGVPADSAQGLVAGVAMGIGTNTVARPTKTQSHVPSDKILDANSVDQVISEFEADGMSADSASEAALSQQQPKGMLSKAPELYRAMYEEAGRRYGVDPELLAAQGFAESGFDPDAVSPAGARGIAQFMPATAQEYEIDPMNPAEAIDGQARYMAKMLERYDGDVSKALAAYNAGPGRVDDGSWQSIGETQTYVDRILGELGQESGPMAAEWAAQQQAAPEYNQARNKPQLDESIQFAGPAIEEVAQEPVAPPVEEDAPLEAAPQPVSGEQIAKNEPQSDLPLTDAPQQATTEPAQQQRIFVPDVQLVEPIATQIEEDVQPGQGSGSQVAKNESQPDLRSIDNPQPRFVPDVPLEQVKTVDNGDGSFSMVHKETGESILDGQSYGSRKEARAAFVQERAAMADVAETDFGNMEKAAKEPWQMTRKEYYQHIRTVESPGRANNRPSPDWKKIEEAVGFGINGKGKEVQPLPKQRLVGGFTKEQEEALRVALGDQGYAVDKTRVRNQEEQDIPAGGGWRARGRDVFPTSPEHERSVRAALADNLPVPASVLADYPDLADANALPARNNDVNADIETELSGQLGSGRAGRLISKGKVEILGTQQDAEAIIRDLDTTPKRSEDGKIQGFTTPDGKVHLVRDGIQKGNAMGVLAHEMGAHAKRLGFKHDAEWQGIVESIDKRSASKGRTGEAIRAAKERIPQDTAKEHVQEELVAYLVEHHANDGIPLVDRIIAHLKKWLYQAGIMSADRFSPKDLAAFARAAIREEAKKADNVFTGGRGKIDSAGKTDKPRLSRIQVENSQGEKDFVQDLEAVAEQVPKKFDIRSTTPWVKTAEYTLSKIAAGRRALEAVSNRQERRFMLQAKILDGERAGMSQAERTNAKEKGFVNTFKQLKKNSANSYAKIQQYLLGVDRTGRGFHLTGETGHIVTTPDGKILGVATTDENARAMARDHVAESGQKGKVLISSYPIEKGTLWTVRKPNKSKIAAFISEQEAVSSMIQAERTELLSRGFTNTEADAIQSFREMTNRAFDEHAEGIREVLRQCEEMGVDPPMVESIDETRRFAVRDKRGKNIATFESREKAENMLRELARTHPKYAYVQVTRQLDSEIQKRISLHDAIAQMGDMRGTYFPRQREHGGMGLRAINESTGEKIFLKGDLYLATLDPAEKNTFLGKGSEALRKVFNSQTPLGREARKLRKQGFAVSLERDNTMPEDVFAASQLTTNIAAMMDESMERVDKGSMTRAQVDAYVEIHKQVTMQLAGIVKQRGALSSRVKRSENYWEGFERDPLKAGTVYANSLAGAVAKRQLAQDLTMIITGRDIPWKDWKAENKGGTWADYTAFVNERKIDPIKQKNIYGETMAWAAEILRNPEAADRIIGTLKGLAVLKYIGFRIPSAAVNLTNLGLAVPATISSHTGVGIARVSRQVGSSLKALLDYRLGRGKEGDARILSEISDRGWDNPQFNQDAAEVLRSRFGNAWQNFVDAGMWLFGQAEIINRRATIHAAYKMWQSSNPELTHAELMQKARHSSDRAHGQYGQETAPGWTRGSANPLKMMWTFQKFGQNYLLNIGEMIGKGDHKQAAWMLLAPVILGGPKATLITPLLVALAKGIGVGGEDPEEELYAWARKVFGTDSWMRFGAPGLLGVSFQGSLAMGIPVVSDLAEKGKRINSLAELFGAPGSVISDLYAAGKHASQGEYLKAAEKALPSAMGSVARAARESTEGVTTESYGSVYYGAEPLTTSGVETYLRGLSFAPSEITGKRQRQWSELKIKNRYAEERQDINREIKRLFLQYDYSPPDDAWARVLVKIDRYNDKVVGLNRPDIPPITIKQVKSMLKRNAKASKIEQSRQAELRGD